MREFDRDPLCPESLRLARLLAEAQEEEHATRNCVEWDRCEAHKVDGFLWETDQDDDAENGPRDDLEIWCGVCGAPSDFYISTPTNSNGATA